MKILTQRKNFQRIQYFPTLKNTWGCTLLFQHLTCCILFDKKNVALTNISTILMMFAYHQNILSWYLHKWQNEIRKWKLVPSNKHLQPKMPRLAIHCQHRRNLGSWWGPWKQSGRWSRARARWQNDHPRLTSPAPRPRLRGQSTSSMPPIWMKCVPSLVVPTRSSRKCWV